MAELVLPGSEPRKWLFQVSFSPITQRAVRLWNRTLKADSGQVAPLGWREPWEGEDSWALGWITACRKSALWCLHKCSRQTAMKQMCDQVMGQLGLECSPTCWPQTSLWVGCRSSVMGMALAHVLLGLPGTVGMEHRPEAVLVRSSTPSWDSPVHFAVRWGGQPRGLWGTSVCGGSWLAIAFMLLSGGKGLRQERPLQTLTCFSLALFQKDKRTLSCHMNQ